MKKEDFVDLAEMRWAVKKGDDDGEIIVRNRFLMRHIGLLIFFAKRQIKNLYFSPLFKQQLFSDPVHRDFRDHVQAAVIGAMYSLKEYVKKFPELKGPNIFKWIEYGVKKAIRESLLKNSHIHVAFGQKETANQASKIASRFVSENDRRWQPEELENELKNNGWDEKKIHNAESILNMNIFSIDSFIDSGNGNNGHTRVSELGDVREKESWKLIDLKLLVGLILSGKRLNKEQDLEKDLAIFKSWLWEDMEPWQIAEKYGFKAKQTTRRAITRVIEMMKKEDLEPLHCFLTGKENMLEAVMHLNASRQKRKIWQRQTASNQNHGKKLQIIY